MIDKRLKVLFVRPISPLSEYAVVNMQHPINLTILGAIVESGGHNAYIYDFEIEGNSIKKFLDYVGEIQPDIVGFSCTTPQIRFADRLCGEIKSIYPHIICIVGGAHISAIPIETINEFNNIDYGFVGEADLSLREFLTSLSCGERSSNIRGVIHKNNGEIYYQPMNERLGPEDINILPARHLLNIQKYYRLNRFKNVAAPGVYKKGIRSTQFFTSRGCIYRCIFCSNISNFGTNMKSARIVARDISSIEEEILDCKYRYGINHLSVQDELFPASRELLHKFCEITAREGITFNCNTRADILKEEDYRILRESGCLQVGIGVESGSERILRLIGKSVKKEEIGNSFELARKYRIRRVGYFLIGSHPDETEEDVFETIRFIKDIKPDLITCTLAVPYPGTRLRKILEEQGLIFSNDWDRYAYYSDNPVWRTIHFTPEQMISMQLRVLRSFYLSPSLLRRRIEILSAPDEIFMLFEGGLRMIKFIKNRFITYFNLSKSIDEAAVSSPSNEDGNSRFSNRVDEVLELLNMSRARVLSGSGAYIKLEDGREILDMWGAYGANALGINNRDILNVVRTSLDESKVNVVFPFKRDESALLSGKLCSIAHRGIGWAIFTTGGSESVDVALRVAAKYRKRGGRYICFTNSFHGKTIGTLSITNQPAIKRDIPLLKDIIVCRFNDAKMFEKIIERDGKNIDAVVMELIQANGGIIQAENGFVERINTLCKTHNIPIIDDEVSTGLGRTGKWFAYEHYRDFKPDIICIGKHLGGGVFPLGATLISRDICEQIGLNPLEFYTTFSEEALALSAGTETLNIIDREGMLSKVDALGKYIFDGLNRLKAKFKDKVKDIRGMGLIIGIELVPFIHKKIPNIYALGIMRRLYEQHNVLVGITSSNPSVIRLHPPFVLTKEDIDRFISAIDEALSHPVYDIVKPVVVSKLLD